MLILFLNPPAQCLLFSYVTRNPNHNVHILLYLYICNVVLFHRYSKRQKNSHSCKKMQKNTVAKNVSPCGQVMSSLVGQCRRCKIIEQISKYVYIYIYIHIFGIIWKLSKNAVPPKQRSFCRKTHLSSKRQTFINIILKMQVSHVNH